jgi:hypothetical protein
VEYVVSDSAAHVSRVELNGQVLNAEEVANPYRHGGLSVPKDVIENYPEDEVLKLRVFK